MKKEEFKEDKLGNLWKEETIKKGGIVKIITTYKLEKGKTTLRGQYKKLSEEKCKFKDRLDCNSGDFYNRCRHMKYEIPDGMFTSGRWYCDNEE